MILRNDAANPLRRTFRKIFGEALMYPERTDFRDRMNQRIYVLMKRDRSEKAFLIFSTADRNSDFAIFSVEVSAHPSLRLGG
ncbi:MAG: hypothetical protein ACLPN1_04700 [Dissulfurispiraceae bacterium]|jgi:hypothetical protein